MSEVATLSALEARTGLLRREGNESELTNNAAEFTRLAAWELRADGWGNVRKTGGLNVRGLDVDKILHRNTLAMMDIVIGAGARGQHVGWQHVATGVPSQWVAPEDPSTGQPGPEPVPDDLLDAMLGVRERVDELEQIAKAQLEESRAMRQILERAAAQFGV